MVLKGFVLAVVVFSFKMMVYIFFVFDFGLDFLFVVFLEGFLRNIVILKIEIIILLYMEYVFSFLERILSYRIGFIMYIYVSFCFLIIGIFI